VSDLKVVSLAPTPPAVPAFGPGLVRLRLLLRNLEPLNLAMTAEAGNLIRGQSYIPGGRVRAAVLHWLGKGAESDHFASPAVLRVGNGYVVPDETHGPVGDARSIADAAFRAGTEGRGGR